MGKPLSYGERIAADIVAKRARQAAERKPKQARVRKAPPKVDLYPLDNYVYRRTQEHLPWDSDTLATCSSELSTRLTDGESNMQLLVAGLGSGKTSIGVATLGRMQQARGQRLAFVVAAPKAVIDGAGWQETICSYNEAHPDNMLVPTLITTHDKLANIIENGSSKAQLIHALDGDGILVLDEAHAYKNPTSKRSKQLQKLSSFKRLGISATPLTNDIIMDSASYLIMAGYYRNKTQFMDEEGLGDYLDQYYRLTLLYNPDGSVNEDIWSGYSEIKRKLSRVFYQPTIEVPLSEFPEVRNVVVQLEQSVGLDLDMESLARANKKRMFPSATDLVLAMCERVCADDVRLDKLVEICSSEGVVQPLVFFWHVATRDAIIGRLDAEGISCQIVDGEHSMVDIDLADPRPILIQYAAGSEGVEFKGSNTSVFYENQYSYTRLTQARGRNVRRGTGGVVTQYNLIAQQPFDQQLYQLLVDKAEVNEETLGELAAESLPTVG